MSIEFFVQRVDLGGLDASQDFDELQFDCLRIDFVCRVRLIAEDDVLETQDLRGSQGFTPPLGSHLLLRPAERIGRASAIGHDERGNLGSFLNQFGSGASHTDLHVIGMRADNEYVATHRLTQRSGAVTSGSRIPRRQDFSKRRIGGGWSPLASAML